MTRITAKAEVCEELIKSQFIEMFENPISINWDIFIEI